MYTMRDKIIDGVTGVLLGAAFILVYAAASLMDLATVGMQGALNFVYLFVDIVYTCNML